MKTVIFFDIDNTIYNNTLNKIPEQTYKLLSELSKKENVVLGLATGRSNKKIEIISEILQFFRYKVLINGSVVFCDNKIIYEHKISKKDIDQAIEVTKNYGVSIGMVGLEDEAVNYYDEKVSKGMKSLRGVVPHVDQDFHQNNNVYQFWIYDENEERLLDVAKKIDNFEVYPWHTGGADFIYPEMNKAFGIKKALENVKDYQLICIGDGANDIKMVEMADVGIAMSNTRFGKLKEKANHLAPHIMDDQLYDFFKSINLI